MVRQPLRRAARDPPPHRCANREDLKLPTSAALSFGPLLGRRRRYWRSAFAEAVERVCIQTVEGGKMTKDLALLVGEDQDFLTTEEFLDAIDQNLQKEMQS